MGSSEFQALRDDESVAAIHAQTDNHEPDCLFAANKPPGILLRDGLWSERNGESAQHKMNVSRIIRHRQGGARGAQELRVLEPAQASVAAQMAGGGAAHCGPPICADALGSAGNPKQCHQTQNGQSP